MKFNLLNKMKLWQKLGLLLLIALLMTAFPFYQFYTTQQTKLDFALREITGIEPSRVLARVAQRMAEHRGLAERAAAGDATAASALKAKAPEVTAAINAANERIAAFGYDSVNKAWAKVKADWTKVVAAPPALGASFDAHTKVIEQVLATIELAADESFLTFDPDPHTYYLYSNGMVTLPKVYEYLAQARDFGAGRLVEASARRSQMEAQRGVDMAKAEWMGAAERARLQGTLDFVGFFGDTTSAAYVKALAAMPRLKDRLGADIKAAADAQTTLAKLTNTEIISNPRPMQSGAEYSDAYGQRLASVAKLTEATYDALRDELQIVAAGHRSFQLQISALVAVLTVLGTLVAYLIVRNITGTVATLQSSVDRVRGGDLTALGTVESKDEVGDLGRTVNLLLNERVAAQQKAEEENEKLNMSVIQLLSTVADLSQRDLTVKAPVTEDIIGTVGDSINQLTDATASVLRDVTKIAGVVEHASKRVKTQSDAVNSMAESERHTVDRLVGSLREATTAMDEVTRLAQTSNMAAAEASKTTESAMTTVESTVRGMDTIRETISEMEKRIKRLGERSQEISQIVGLINTISERTHVLSLNASMQAAMAGDAGRGFAVVAEEVQRLAENSRQATAQIANLVQNIQIETNDTISTVNKTIDQVVQGSELARQSGQRMRETRETTERLVQMVHTISRSAQQQVRIAADLQSAASEIALSTKKTEEQLTQQNQVTTSLVSASQKLVESVSVFKLPNAA
jgi:methyl-accepting chemotaxis protein